MNGGGPGGSAIGVGVDLVEVSRARAMLADKGAHVFVRLLRTILISSACLAQPLAGQATDSLAVARRIVAAAALAAKEYALGVTPAGGKITRPEEVAEAKLFIQQAQFDIAALPATARAGADRGLTRLSQLLQRLAPPDSVSREAV